MSEMVRRDFDCSQTVEETTFQAQIAKQENKRVIDRGLLRSEMINSTKKQKQKQSFTSGTWTHSAKVRQTLKTGDLTEIN